MEPQRVPKPPHPLISKVKFDKDGSPIYVVEKIEDIPKIEKSRKQARLERQSAIYPAPKRKS